VPREIELRENFVAARGIGIRIHGGQPPTAQIAADNFVFAAQPLVGGVQRENRTGALDDAEAAFAVWADRAATGSPTSSSRRDTSLRRRLAAVCLGDAEPERTWGLPADQVACRWANRQHDLR